VTADLDGGPIVAQAAVAVLPGDDESTLAARVLAQEHRLYPQAIRWILDGRLALGEDGRVRLSGVSVSAQCLLVPPLEDAAADGNRVTVHGTRD
jgi:phosphoribosylglycinamide formyltransferase-1